MPAISVILCSYQRPEKVRRCFSALKAQNIPQEQFEVICVNDGSCDETGAAMREGLESLDGIYIEHSHNRALAAARNNGIRAASGEIVVLINDDTYPEKTFLFEHYFAHRRNAGKRIAVLGYIPFSEEYAKRFFSVLLMQHNLYFPFSGMVENQHYSYSHFIGGNISIARDAFFEHDIWFDESFRCYGYEDIECGYRFAQEGYSVLYHPQARVIHDHKVTLEEYRARAEKNALNIIEMLCRHPELRVNIFGVERLDQKLMEQWRSFIESATPNIETLAEQIGNLEEVSVGLNPEAQPQEAQALEQAANALSMLREFDERRTFLDILAREPSYLEQLSA